MRANRLPQQSLTETYAAKLAQYPPLISAVPAVQTGYPYVALFARC